MRINFPLALTLGRVAAIPLVLALFYVDWPHARQWACVLFALAGITDWLDGYLARKWNQTSKFGAFLDPVADKLLVAISLVMLLRDEPGGVMAILVAVIIGREITISALREWLAELGQRTTVAVSMVGKVKTGFQMTAIGLMLWQQPFLGLPIYEIGYLCLFVASALTIWSMVVYLRAAWPLLRESMPQ
ncbi:CDP-diacylglycerol--glycerol-3-phosphate 3-phosphatidyltransferase [Stagnimonas aquatica]|uniref:CDP-diacylglycerol--glycerol-3-phosphate 3-phosphatidyltransferase n=1 Tax=Stagnimonas aquatica TaxID=2689987 RepID=A0A3N0V9L9_9GAMM|nr:CDP-diacylglycerol--glycerol-3-phosphate 3-phosphatidyltransferase [Stagnimonas aquatica]ROH89487.1 CDP-diacylglycerol--glycerol-3-phosphate 3-phosphatidyltransferase [Stagnimonas aquatica]